VAFSQIRTRVFENSSERKNYGIRGFKGFSLLGYSLGDWYAITNVAIEKDWFDGSLQHLCKSIWFSYNTSY